MTNKYVCKILIISILFIVNFSTVSYAKKTKARDLVAEQNEIVKKRRKDNILYNPYDETFINTIPLNSKEYKLELRPELFFKGLQSIDKFRKVIESSLTPGQLVKSYIGKGRIEKKTRKVYFYDTPNTCVLANNGYYLRERVSYEIDSRTVDLKYRSIDIEESGDRLVDNVHKVGKQKFEADIVGINTLYTHSNKTEIPLELDIAKSALDIYPVLSRSGLTREHKLVKVGNYTAHEYNYALAKVQFDSSYIDTNNPAQKKSKVGTIRKMELTLWFLPGEDKPMGAELSWKLKDRRGAYKKETLRNAGNLYNKIKVNDVWVNPYPESKTLLFYSNAGGFCDSSATLASTSALTILSYEETVSVNKIGGASVSVDVLLKGKNSGKMLLPLNFKEALNVKGNMPIRAVKITGTWYFLITLDGRNKIHFEFDVNRYLDWRIGLDIYGYPNLAKGQFGNVSLNFSS
ncbi:MAG: hypothetical protein ISR65_13730 [Bacteriovoracaceae bacterium]|nr:hypothetical protein [Bacteriovoracaceae bacterium]